MSDKPRYDNGEFHAMTLGQFISILVDAGTDPAVIMRVVDNWEPDENGQFIRAFEVIIVPTGRSRKQSFPTVPRPSTRHWMECLREVLSNEKPRRHVRRHLLHLHQVGR